MSRGIIALDIGSRIKTEQEDIMTKKAFDH